jgi:hypothetical protein
MVLSNAERQARYRERLKQLAAKGVMSPLQAQMLTDVRRHLREWRRSIAAFAEGRMKLWTNHVDTTAEHVAMLEKMIATNEQLLVQYDPDDLTADGSVELGEVTSREFNSVLPGRWVSYLLDDQGRAVDLHLFDDAKAARGHAWRSGRNVGVIGEDMWSISPEPTWTAYALVQKMPSGWWRALISGWQDLPEQYGLSRDNAVDEIGRVAREYLKERFDQGMRLPDSWAASHEGWECIPISVDI